jgi:hypothetical protein
MFSVNAYLVDGSESKKRTLPFENVDTQCLQPELSRLSFEIFKDESVVLGRGENGTSCAPQPARRVDHYKISRNEVEGIGQMQKSSGSLLDPAQEGLVFRDSIQTLSSVKRDIKMSEQIEASNENCPSSYFKEDNIAAYSADDELQCPQICTCNCQGAVNNQVVSCNHIKITVDAPVSSGESSQGLYQSLSVFSFTDMLK